ncbi:hypothetical protein [Caballeronia sp. BR00000012568055]|uniref:hypothetical protein n=1 Tax=Caballeronia sp. BR00000012568055 TaxID=2918761 RepID=UPI0023F7E1AA|nr:hypothetical protein [Caballeronia sp. BR00000012568055]
MIGPQNAITLQSSKTNLLDGYQNFLFEPCSKGFSDFYSAWRFARSRTVSAHVRVRVVRVTLKPCIDAINAIKLHRHLRSV